MRPKERRIPWSFQDITSTGSFLFLLCLFAISLSAVLGQCSLLQYIAGEQHLNQGEIPKLKSMSFRISIVQEGEVALFTEGFEG